MNSNFLDLIRDKEINATYSDKTDSLIAEGGNGILYIPTNDKIWYFDQTNFREHGQELPNKTVDSFIVNCNHTYAILLTSTSKPIENSAKNSENTDATDKNLPLTEKQIEIFQFPTENNANFEFKHRLPTIPEKEFKGVKWCPYSPEYFIVHNTKFINIYKIGQDKPVLEHDGSYNISSLCFGSNVDPWLNFALLQVFNRKKLSVVRGFIPKEGLEIEPRLFTSLKSTLQPSDQEIFDSLVTPNGSKYVFKDTGLNTLNKFDVKFDQDPGTIESIAMHDKFLFILGFDRCQIYELDLVNKRHSYSFIGNHPEKPNDYSERVDFKFICETQVDKNSQATVVNNKVYIYGSKSIWLFNEMDRSLVEIIKYNEGTIKAIGHSYKVHAFAMLNISSNKYQFYPVPHSTNTNRNRDNKAAAREIEERVKVLKQKMDEVNKREQALLTRASQLIIFIDREQTDLQAVSELAQKFQDLGSDIIDKMELPEEQDVDEEIRKLLGDKAELAVEIGKLQTNMLAIQFMHENQ